MATTSIIDKLQVLTELYKQGYQSHLLEQSLNKIIELEQENTFKKIQEFIIKLQAYEQKYQLSSEQFYQQFIAGQLGDSMDFFEWSSFYDMYQAAQSRLLVLQSLNN
ncbi:MAG: hypothetical protein VKJ02_01855 [Snowella sp.]|nr:hypothetical protein [Snowella sp.]